MFEFCNELSVSMKGETERRRILDKVRASLSSLVRGGLVVRSGENSTNCAVPRTTS
jgi:chromosome condensin MukBEF MukE localization factor